MSLVIWHNPRCTKSRETLKLLQENGYAPEVREYLSDVPDVAEMKAVLKKLGFASVRDWMRTKEADYRALGLKDESDEDKLIAAMIDNPKLIERPVVIKGDKAALGRPPESVLRIL
ncbi:arsenate reductase (glutaredoxin) [Hyphobacterium sp. HN65]|uniref:Arsenate reductase n=1 Tax=Hyphobacterium lacteum TaxID=3116575 RepID=A0ABU7LTS6_9PROT|nr:arsenate reductase (glutaredoxin) [Hyphobacterium sp. HN65]MEE2527302.1 arsenate reductase (glutaredoxin) [Hyphobacterium sp. HN65]